MGPQLVYYFLNSDFFFFLSIFLAAAEIKNLLLQKCGALQSEWIRNKAMWLFSFEIKTVVLFRYYILDLL